MAINQTGMVGTPKGILKLETRNQKEETGKVDVFVLLDFGFHVSSFFYTFALRFFGG